jgi:hypothetical protein
MTQVDDQTKTYILEKYIRRAVDGVKHRGRGHEIKVNCPFCGDKEMKGTLWLTNTYRWCYTCWRASCRCADHGILATKWLKEVNPSLHQEYLDEIKSYGKKDKKETDALKVLIERQREDDAIKQKKMLESDMEKDKQATKFFKKITKPGQFQQAAVEFCKKRMIPEEVWKKFYYCDEGKYHGRVIIPFYDKDGKIVFFQGRTLDGSKAKYMSRVGHTALYNWDFIDKSKAIAVLEGPINAMFVENGTATVGAGSSGGLDEQLKDLDCWYIFDNDDAGRKHAYKKVQEGKPVFMWNTFIFSYNLPRDINDINDAIMFLKRTKKFTIKELQHCFTRYVEQYKALELAKVKMKPIKPNDNAETEEDGID